MFYQECREKKKIGTNVYHRASRLGYIRGGVRTPSDFLSAKEKRKLNGEVRVSNILDQLENVPHIKTINQMEYKEANRILSYVKKTHRAVDIAKHFGISTGTLPHYYTKFGVYIDSDGKKKSRRKYTGVGGYSSIDDIPKYPEFILLPLETQRNMLKVAREQFGVSPIKKHFECSQTKIYKLFHKLDLIEPEVLANKNESEEDNVLEVVLESTQPKFNPNLPTYREEDVVKALSDLGKMVRDQITTKEMNTDNKLGFRIEFGGEYSKDEIENRLLSISSTFIDGKNYKIKLSVEEV